MNAWEALKRFAAARGKDWTDLDTQIAYLDHELRTNESEAGDKLRNVEDAAEGASVFMHEFERPDIFLRTRTTVLPTLWLSITR